MYLPQQVNEVIDALERAEFEAYAVGGCVRDALLKRDPGDYDVTTSARPEEIKRVFAGQRLIETGLKHGTVTVLTGGMPVEVTTYRVDGGYSDHRHPDAVRFTVSLREDLARRDFTMNAMAWSDRNGVVDCFGGAADIEHRLIRCVGDPDRRFREDALRILRAIRFASELDFTIEEETAGAIFRNRELLRQISAERVREELVKLLCGGNVRAVLMGYIDVVGVVTPEALAMKGFDQRNPHHVYDVLEHSAAAAEQAPPRPALRLAAFLHDIGKPPTFSQDDQGVGHFYGHGEEGARLADELLARLKFDNATRKRVVRLVKYHDAQCENNERSVKRWINRLGPEEFFELLALKRADNLAQSPAFGDRRKYYDNLERLAREILEGEQCFSLKNLAVNGDDLIACGMKPGRELGRALQTLLDAVVGGEVENEKEALMAWYERHPGA